MSAEMHLGVIAAAAAAYHVHEMLVVGVDADVESARVVEATCVCQSHPRNSGSRNLGLHPAIGVCFLPLLWLKPAITFAPSNQWTARITHMESRRWSISMKAQAASVIVCTCSCRRGCYATSVHAQ